MPEAEDVIVDAARHVTVLAQNYWRQRSPQAAFDPALHLERLDLLIASVFGRRYSLRHAPAPLRMSLAKRLLDRHARPTHSQPIPATDGSFIWLPIELASCEHEFARLRVIALQQAMRAEREAPKYARLANDHLERACFEVLNSAAADAQLAIMLPGLGDTLRDHRDRALNERPALSGFSAERKMLESWVRDVMSTVHANVSAQACLQEAMHAAPELRREMGSGAERAALLYRDLWTGELRDTVTSERASEHAAQSDPQHSTSPRSARLNRRPTIREADERDRKQQQGAWMVQTTQPMEHAEDPFGMQRPMDRDSDTSPDELADSVSELDQARLISTSSPAKEVLLSDDLPSLATVHVATEPQRESIFRYPEWDYRRSDYARPGAAVHVLPCGAGSREWVRATLDAHRSLSQAIRRQFESIRAQRQRMYRQQDGDEIDLSAAIEGIVDLRAGTGQVDKVYEYVRPARRELSVQILIDVSGSTDSWVAENRRVIDVAREALLMVCIALDSLREPYSVMAFSGEGSQAVTVRMVKAFEEFDRDAIALRIASLEPENYTRAGAAIRHASAALMARNVRHRLLLMLSDGKPNDMDEYEGRYGVEDMRRAVIEARLQGIFPFCLTIDRQMGGYLPGVFGQHHYAMLQTPQMLPTALVGWLAKLIKTG
jgi:nitric oxide reductase NorD protein